MVLKAPPIMKRLLINRVDLQHKHKAFKDVFLVTILGPEVIIGPAIMRSGTINSAQPAGWKRKGLNKTSAL